MVYQNNKISNPIPKYPYLNEHHQLFCSFKFASRATSFCQLLTFNKIYVKRILISQVITLFFFIQHFLSFAIQTSHNLSINLKHLPNVVLGRFLNDEFSQLLDLPPSKTDQRQVEQQYIRRYCIIELYRCKVNKILLSLLPPFSGLQKEVFYIKF